MPMTLVPRTSSMLLAVVAAVPMVGRAQPMPAGAAPVQSINHVRVRVTDPARSYESYRKLFGGRIIDTSKREWTMMLGDTRVWLSLSTESTNKPSEIDHIGVGIDLPGKPDALRRALIEAFPSSQIQSPGKAGDKAYNRAIDVSDPDGFGLQLVATTDAGRVDGADKTPVVPRSRAE